MEYTEALEYIQNIQGRLGSDYSLTEVAELSKRLGRPERELKIIHIAGTNGKGSVGNFVSNMLAQAGYIVGRYLSPTLFDYRERVQKVVKISERVKSMWMTEEEAADALTLLKEKCEEMKQDGFSQPTAFEIETVMSFWLFCQWKVDVAVVETGLGGRVDATNIIEYPLLCVFTSISRDHMQFLGDTIEEIATEKYGIIQKGTTVVSLYQKECHLLLEECCKKKRATLVYISENRGGCGRIQNSGMDSSVLCQRQIQNTFSYQGEEYELSQGGSYQLENAMLAVEVIVQLQKMGEFFVSMQQRKDGLYFSRWRGRFDIVSKQPFVLADGAHNEDAVKKLCASLQISFPEEKFLFLIGVFRDKEYEKMIEELLPLAKKFVTVAPPGKRGLLAEELGERIRTVKERQGGKKDMFCEVVCCGSVKEALDVVCSESLPDKTVVCGSLSILGEVYSYFEKKPRL